MTTPQIILIIILFLIDVGVITYYNRGNETNNMVIILSIFRIFITYVLLCALSSIANQLSSDNPCPNLIKAENVYIIDTTK